MYKIIAPTSSYRHIRQLVMARASSIPSGLLVLVSAQAARVPHAFRTRRIQDSDITDKTIVRFD